MIAEIAYQNETFAVLKEFERGFRRISDCRIEDYLAGNIFPVLSDKSFIYGRAGQFMHYELVTQCNPTERHQVIRKIEMSGGRIKDIMEDQSRLLLFIEYDDVTPQKSHWFEMLHDLVTQVGETFSLPTPTV